MISEKMQKALVEQINAEFFSGYLYLSMAAYCESLNFEGFANWMEVQAQEELSHGMKIYRYVNERGGRVELGAIDKPDTQWKDLIAVFDQVYSHEQKVTGLIYNLVSIAREEKDYATESFLSWFVDEQVEEEANASGLLEKIRFVEGKGAAIMMLDAELKNRVFVNEALAEE